MKDKILSGKTYLGTELVNGFSKYMENYVSGLKAQKVLEEI